MAVLALPVGVFGLVRAGVFGAWASFRPWAYATAIGTSLLVASYFWAFEERGCGGVENVACRLNENQGVLTLLALLLAVGAVWVTAVTRELDRRDRERSAREDLRNCLVAAVLECDHNLIHVAVALRGTLTLHEVPQLTVNATSRLRDDPALRHRLPDALLIHADAVCRNFEQLDRLMPGVAFPVAPPPEQFQAFATRSIGVLHQAVHAYPGWTQPLLPPPIYRDLAALGEAKFEATFAASEFVPKAHELRRDDFTVLCWRADADLPAIRVFAMGQRYEDRAKHHAPH